MPLYEFEVVKEKIVRYGSDDSFASATLYDKKGLALHLTNYEEWKTYAATGETINESPVFYDSLEGKTLQVLPEKLTCDPQYLLDSQVARNDADFVRPMVASGLVGLSLGFGLSYAFFRQRKRD